MTNLTGAYDVAIEVSVAAVNRVLAVLHENQDPRFAVLPHSMAMFVDDTPRGAADPVPEAERTGLQAQVEVQVSTPTISLPQGGQVVDGVAWAIRGPGPWMPPQPSDVNISAAVRTWVKGSTQPPLPEFLHGDIIVSADIVRTSVGVVGPQLPAQAILPGPGGFGPGSTFPLAVETFLGLDRTSLGVLFRPAPGTVVSGEDQRRIEQIIRNLLRGDLQPVTFQVSVPEDVKGWDYKLAPDHASAIAALMLTDRTPAAGGIDGISGGWIPSGADFAIAVGRDYILNHILPVLRSEVLRDVPNRYTVSWGVWPFEVSAEVRPDWGAAGFDLESGRIVLSITGDGDISYPAGIDDGFSFTVRVGLTLAIAGGALELRAVGDPEVHLSGVELVGGYLEGQVRDRIRDVRDRALEAARDRIRDVLQVQQQLEKILAGIQPAPPGVTLTRVAVRYEGITVTGTTSLAPSNPVVVRQVKQGPMVDALDSWIPGGTIDRFRWYRSTPVLAPLLLGGTGVPPSGDVVEEHQFVTEEDTLGHAYAPVTCLEVQGTRVTPSGVVAPISGHTCGFYHPLLPWLVTGFPGRAARAWPVLPLRGLRPDGEVGTVGHYSPWASGRAPREGPTTMVVHFAGGDWEQTAAALQKALSKHPQEAALVVVILFGEGALSELDQAPMRAEAAFLLGEDVDDHWAEAYGVAERPATVLVDAGGRVAWKEEGSLTPPELARALQEHAERGGRVSWQPLRLGVVAGDKPPEFPFRVGRGAELSLRRLRGRRLAVTFWTSWCEPSITQLREFSRTYGAGDGAGPLVLAVGDGERIGVTAEIAHELDLPFPLLPDPERKISERFGVGCWPSTVWIGTTMRVEAVNFGLTAVAEPAGLLP